MILWATPCTGLAAILMARFADTGNGAHLGWAVFLIVCALAIIIEDSTKRIIETLRDNRKATRDATAWIVSVLRDIERGQS